MRAALPCLVGCLLGAAAHADELPRFLRLRVDPEKAYKERARPREVTPVTVVPGGPQAGEAPFGNPQVVVGVEGHLIRVVAENDLARIAYYLDETAVPVVSRAGALVVSTREAAAARRAPSDGVRLVPGIDLGVTTPAEGGVFAVSWEQGDDHGTGFVGAAQAGRTYVPGELPSVGKANVFVAVPIEILDGPGGKVIASIGGKGDVDGRRMGKASSGFVRVGIDCEYGRVIGWAPADKVEPIPPGVGRGIGANSGIPVGGVGRSNYIEHGVLFTVGTVLRASPKGPMVGVLREALMVSSAAGAEDGFLAIDVDGPFGSTKLYAPLPKPE